MRELRLFWLKSIALLVPKLFKIGIAGDLSVIIQAASCDIFVIFSEDEQSNEKRPNTLKVGALLHTLNFKRRHYLGFLCGLV